MLTSIDPHASKAQQYSQLCRALSALIEGEQDLVANLANASALLYHSLQDINWIGFYLLKNGELVVGPFQGKPACVRIPLDKGVCGTAAARRTTLIVPNVHEFEGHIACDTASSSEIVVPMLRGPQLLGVMDVDSPKLARFDEEDRAGLEAIAALLAATS